MNAHTILDFMREKGLKAAVAILLAAAMQSPVAAGIVIAVFALSTVTLERLLRPSTWPRLCAWPLWTWGTMFYLVPSYLLAWYFTTPPDPLMCRPVGPIYFCGEWLPPIVAGGAYLLLVVYDYLQYCDFCDAGTEVLITRIARSDRQGGSLVIHSNVKLSVAQRLYIKVLFCLRSVQCPFEQIYYEGVGFCLCFLSVQFSAKPDGSRTRRISRWISPSCGEPMRFSYYRPFMERMDSHLSNFPFAFAFALFALHSVILKTGCYEPTNIGWLMVLACVAWIALAPAVDAFLDGFVDFCHEVDVSVVPLCELAWSVFCKKMAWELVLLPFGLIVLDDRHLDLHASVRTLIAVVMSCAALDLVSVLPFVGYPIKCAGRAVAPRVAKVMKVTYGAILVVLRLLLVSIAWVCVCLASPRRRMAVLRPREARLKYRRPSLAPLAVTLREVEPFSERGGGGRPAVSASKGRMANRRELVGLRKAVAGKDRKRGVVLGAMACSVAPLRRSVRLAGRVAGSFSRGSVS